MQLITCKNGHRYNPELTSSCPECALLYDRIPEREGTVELVGMNPVEHIDETQELWGGGDSGSTIPLIRNKEDKMDKTAPVLNHSAEVDEIGKTMMVDRSGNFISKKEQNITGWLVCVAGPEKGRDYRLHNENNFIGRGSKNDVCIPSDATISSDKHCVITYDSESRKFYIGLFAGASIIRLNNQPVLMAQELKTGDKIRIGQCTFLFVPLCGENFEWDE